MAAPRQLAILAKPEETNPYKIALRQLENVAGILRLR